MGRAGRPQVDDGVFRVPGLFVENYICRMVHFYNSLQVVNLHVSQQQMTRITSKSSISDNYSVRFSRVRKKFFDGRQKKVDDPHIHRLSTCFCFSGAVRYVCDGCDHDQQPDQAQVREPLG